MLPALGASGRAAEPGALPLNILRAPGPVVIDGKLNDWVLTAPVSYEMDSTALDNRARTYAAWDDQYLYLAYVVRDASPMKNAGCDPSGAFKTGDALHLYLSTDSDPATKRSEGGPKDFHVMMAIQQGKPLVYAFRQQKAGVTDQTMITAAGGSTKIGMAWMGPVTGADMVVTTGNDPQGFKSYTAEVKIPWAFFDGLTPKEGLKLAADVAVDFSDPAGARNMAKVWWHRGSSQVTDLPTELRFERDRWGIGELRAAGQTTDRDRSGPPVRRSGAGEGNSGRRSGRLGSLLRLWAAGGRSAAQRKEQCHLGDNVRCRSPLPGCHFQE